MFAVMFSCPACLQWHQEPCGGQTPQQCVYLLCRLTWFIFITLIRNFVQSVKLAQPETAPEPRQVHLGTGADEADGDAVNLQGDVQNNHTAAPRPCSIPQGLRALFPEGQTLPVSFSQKRLG